MLSSSVMSGSFVTPCTIAHQAPLSVGFSRQESWNGLPFPSPEYLSDPGIEPVSFASPALAGVFFTTVPPGNHEKPWSAKESWERRTKRTQTFFWGRVRWPWKSLNIMNYQGNANWNHNEMPSHTHQNGYYQKTMFYMIKIARIGEDVEKKEPLYTVGGNVNWCSHYGKQFGGSSKNLKYNYYMSLQSHI